MKGITGENLLGMLEKRLDNVIYRMGFGTSRAQARQMVRHGHIQVNGRKVEHPIVPGEAERRRSKCARRARTIRRSWPPATPRRMRRRRTGWKWIERICGPRVLAQPKREELVQIQMNEQLIVELYSK